ncbi:MAG: hypothetical protein QM571_03645 [Micrococcaceae bacterium]
MTLLIIMAVLIAILAGFIIYTKQIPNGFLEYPAKPSDKKRRKRKKLKEE